MDPLYYSKTLFATELKMLQENLKEMNSHMLELQYKDTASKEEMDFKQENIFLLLKQIADLKLGLEKITAK